MANSSKSYEYTGQEEVDVYVDSGVGQPDRLERIWAPFRMAYIKKRTQDPFVEAPKKTDEDALIIARGEEVYALLNLFPYNAGHLMVVPYRKVANFEDLTDSETMELMAFVKKSIRVLKKLSNPEGINVGFNLGKASGGSVGDHLHMHVVPKLDNGAPLTGEEEFDKPDFDAVDKYGLPTIDRNSHIARAQAPDGKPQERMLRRAFNYDMQPDYAPISETGFVNDEEELSGTDVQLSNSGLVFICFQKDMTKVFEPMQRRMDEVDLLNEWITHIGSAVYFVSRHPLHLKGGSFLRKNDPPFLVPKCLSGSVNDATRCV